MISHRFISFLLLVTYGVPAGLGPFWHSHDHASSGCCSDHCNVSHYVASDSDATEETHACDESHHHAPLASEGSDSSNPRSLGVRQDLSFTDACLICSFYAQAVFPSGFEEPQAFQRFTHAIVLPGVSAKAIHHAAFQARGPPLAL